MSMNEEKPAKKQPKKSSEPKKVTRRDNLKQLWRAIKNNDVLPIMALISGIASVLLATFIIYARVTMQQALTGDAAPNRLTLMFSRNPDPLTYSYLTIVIAGIIIANLALIFSKKPLTKKIKIFALVGAMSCAIALVVPLFFSW